jgi:hypothetical protein
MSFGIDNVGCLSALIMCPSKAWAVLVETGVEIG